MTETNTKEIPFVYEVLNLENCEVVDKIQFEPLPLATGITFQRAALGSMKFARLKIPQGIPDWTITFTPETLREIADWVEKAEAE